MAKDKNSIRSAGMIDTGADVTILSKELWPKDWPLVQLGEALTGIGGNALPLQSRNMILIEGPDKHVASVRPFVLATPITLWGRVCMSQWGVQIGSNLS